MEEFISSGAKELALIPQGAAEQSLTASQNISQVKSDKLDLNINTVMSALGGVSNIQSVEACAQTRLRVVLKSSDAIDDAQIIANGVQAILPVSANTLHLLVGLNADQYANELKAQLVK